MTIKQKFIVGYSISALLLIIIGVVVMIGLIQIDSNITEISGIDINEQQQRLTEIRQIVQYVIVVMVVLALIVGGFAGSIALWMFWAVIKPLKILEQTISALTAGDLSKRANVSSKDEIGVLAMHFNQMADQLNAYYRQLKEQTKGALSQVNQLALANKGLADTGKAMLNILEDARVLEEELKVEKAGVEKKVVERTKQLTQEHTRLQSSIDSLNAGFFLVDPNLEIVMINPLAKHLLCFSDTHQHPIGVVTNQAIASFDCKMADIEKEMQGIFDFRTQLGKCITEKKPFEVKGLEFKNRFLHIFISPIVMVDEKATISVIGAVVLVEDITEAKILERSKDEFFSIASHELRTPLTAIRGNTALIEQYYAKDLKEPELKSMISDINESAVRLISIVNDFLDVSRLEMGKVEYKTAQIDLVALAKNTIQEYITTGSIKNLYVRLEEPKEPIPAVFVDPDRVKQVLINLIGNGIKFTEKGGVTVKIENIPDLPAGRQGFVKVSVSDTGKGIPEENQKLLFRRFQQAGESLYTRDTTKGTGLGLYISKMLMEGTGGQIELESSDPQKGSVFSFTLPVKPVSQGIKQTQQLPSSSSNGQNLNIRGSVR